MADNSTRTTYFGPVVSFRTEKGHASSFVHVHVPSSGTLEVDALLKSDGTLDITPVAGIKFSGITTASPTSTFIPDGFLSIVSHSGNSLVIAIRSGATTYRFTNDAGGVL